MGFQSICDLPVNLIQRLTCQLHYLDLASFISSLLELLSTSHVILVASQDSGIVMHYLTLLVIFATIVIFGRAEDLPTGLLQVSVGDSRYYFSPNNISGPRGIRVRFYFYGVSFSLLMKIDRFEVKAFRGLILQADMFPHEKNYSVVQTSFENPCHPIPNGFYSGFVVSSLAGPLAPIHFTITLNNTDPIWFYCSQGSLCQQNMLGVINSYVVFQSDT